MKRVLVKFYKKGDAAFLSHRETMRALERALRRSGADLVFTSGFHPRVKASFSPALPLGVAAEAEYLEVAVEREPDLQAMLGRMNEALPRGLGVVSLQLLPDNMPKLSRWARYGLYQVEIGDGVHNLCLRLDTEGGGRLRDALQLLEGRLGAEVGKVTRVGIYASRDEVLEENGGKIVYFYHADKRELEILEEEGAG
ncbi:MAG: TIGR03936 family radical SAM-associated protein [Actinomycetota bacterium]